MPIQLVAFYDPDTGAVTHTTEATEKALARSSGQYIQIAEAPGELAGLRVVDGVLVREVQASAVDVERDRRIGAGVTFAGVVYQSRPGDLENMAGASTAALAAIVNGAVAGDVYWHGGAAPFSWIAEDNSTTEMDAQTMFAFGRAAMEHKQAHIFAARALKDMESVPADFADDAHWP